MAQLGERRVRIAEAEGSNPFGSTNKKRAEWLFFYWWTRGAHTFMQATGFSPVLTRKTTLTVFFHTIFPRKTAQRFCGETGERKPLSRGKAPALIKRDGGTRKRFPHHTAPSLAAGRGVLAGFLGGP